MTALLSPNGTATGFVYRRRLERVHYPESSEAYAEAGFDPGHWNPDGVGFSARVIASITGVEERAELKSRLALFQHPTDQTRQDYFREIAWRVPEWDYTDETRDGQIVAVPAPGEGPDNWEAFDLLPTGVGAWLVETVRTIHLPKRKPWTRSTTATPIPDSTSPATTPPSPS